jgi:hypothetical protein
MREYASFVRQTASFPFAFHFRHAGYFDLQKVSRSIPLLWPRRLLVGTSTPIPSPRGSRRRYHHEMPGSFRVRGARVFLVCAPVLALPLFGVLSAAPAVRAQQPGPSVAEAARKAREQLKLQPAPRILWTNDNVPRNAGTISIVGQPSAQVAHLTSSTVSAPPFAAPAGQAGEAPKKSGGLQEELQQTRDQLASLRTDLELLEREHTLDQKQFYGNPNYTGDSQGKAKLDAQTVRISSTEEAVKTAEERLAALERQLGQPAGISSPPPK